MEILDKTILILGGYGQVGSSMGRLFLAHKPRELIITSLKEDEVLSAAKALSRSNKGATKITPVWGNLFLRWDVRDKDLSQISRDPNLLRTVVDDNMGELTEDVLTSSTLYRVIMLHRPDIIVDCVTTATALGYRNVYHVYEELRRNEKTGRQLPETVDPTDSLLATMAIPPLIRHVQILHEAMKRGDTQLYLKIGTTGTGGMGLNIPFTHGEESPSRLLMAKAAVAGAHSMLLFLLRRMPGGPIIKELKPAAMIGWKGIARGTIKKGGRAVVVVDCPPERAYRLAAGTIFTLEDLTSDSSAENKCLEGTYVDTGENGVFSIHEFKALTSLGLMEFLTPEEIAHNGVELIRGAAGSKDALGALEGAVMNPTYRAGFLREAVVKRMDSLGQAGVSYGLLGPRVSKLLFEAQLLKNAFFTIEAFLSRNADEASEALAASVRDDQNVRREALSVGIAILLPDGEHLLCARRETIDKQWEAQPWKVTPDAIDTLASREWIDLRPENMRRWQKRLKSIWDERTGTAGDSSSHLDRGEGFWQTDRTGGTIIEPGEVTAWVLIYEYGGGRPGAYREK